MKKNTVLFIAVVLIFYIFLIRNVYAEHYYSLDIQYIDEYSSEIIAKGSHSLVPAGTHITAEEKQIKDYTISSTYGNVSESMPASDKKIIYKYKYNKCRITAKYYNDTKNECMLTENKVGIEGDKANFEKKKFNGLKLISKPNDNDMIFNKKDNEIIFHYREYGTINVKYIDKYSLNVLKEKKFEGEVNEKADLMSEKINDYVYENNNFEYKFKSDEQNVNINMIHQGKVNVKYIEKNTNEVLGSFEKTLNENEIFSSQAKEIEGYKLIEKPEKEEIVMGKENQTLTYFYEKIKPDFTILYDIVNMNINGYYHDLLFKRNRKVELTSEEYLNSKDAKIKFNICVRNKGDYKGTCNLKITIPNGYKAIESENQKFIINEKGDIAEINDIKLNKNEQLNYEIVITKIDNSEPKNSVNLLVEVQSNSDEKNINDNSTTITLAMMPISGKVDITIIILIEILIMLFLMYIVYSVIQRNKENT